MAAPMPIRLDAASAAVSPIAGRVAFVLDPFDQATDPLLAALRSLPGVAVPNRPSGLFEDGLDHLMGNYLSAMHLGGGVSALADEQTFLAVVRQLADAVYSEMLRRTGSRVVVDVCSSLPAAQIADALYPDSLLITVGSDDEGLDLLSPDVLRLAPGDHEGLHDLLTGELDRRHASGSRAEPPDNDGRDIASSRLHGRAVFVVGCPRSGTTWLEHMLQAHPDMAGPGRETSVFESLAPLWYRLDERGSDALHDWVGRDDLVSALRRFCDALFMACLKREPHGERRWFLEKTPGHGWHLGLIAVVYPDAWVISIHRDGRDVARSLVEVEFGVDRISAAASVWGRLTGLIERTGPDCPRFRDVRYEKLLDDPVGGTEELLAWVGLPIDDDVHDELVARVGEQVSRYNTSGTISAAKWSTMPSSDLRAVYRHAGERLVEMGYMSADELTRVRSGLAYRLESLMEQVHSMVPRWRSTARH